MRTIDSAPNSTRSSSTTTVYSPSLALQYLTQEEERTYFRHFSSWLFPFGCFPPGVHIENKPAGLLFPTVWTGQLLPVISVVSCFMSGSSAGRWENSRAMGARMAALSRGLFGHFWIKTIPLQCGIAGATREALLRGKLCWPLHSRPPVSTQVE